MHRQRTKFAKRVNRVASSVERRGIAATYELQDRLLGNRRARKRYAAGLAQLDETQQAIVSALDEQGYVSLPFVDLVGDGVWQAVEAQGAAFIVETERTIAEGGLGRVRAGKEFVQRAYSFEGATFGTDNAWFAACASRPMLDIANAYLRLWSKLSYVDLWYTAQQPATDERVASQNWHVDFDDKHLLKAFVYLSDVGPDHGPFEYVPSSQPGGRHHSVRPWRPMGMGRVPDEDVQAQVPAEEIVTFTGSKGTLILCNTSGLHRGGFATAGPRVLATATYCSPASLKALSNRNYDTTLVTTDPVVRYAVS
jgi:phytanoyl-CoA dioxygenase PhyH